MSNLGHRSRLWIRLLLVLAAGGVSLFWLRLIAREVSPTGQMVRDLRRGDADDRLSAILQLSLMRDLDVNRVIEALIEVLEDDDERVRIQAALALNTILHPLNRREGRVPEGWVAPEPATVEAAIAALLEVTDDPSRDVRIQAIQGLEKTPPDSPRAEAVIARLKRMIRDPDPSICVVTVRPLAVLAAGDTSASAALIAAMSDSSDQVRAEVASQVGRLRGADRGSLFPVILDGLRDESPRVRSSARWAAQSIPNPPVSAAPDLMALLSEMASPSDTMLVALQEVGLNAWEPARVLGPVIDHVARSETASRRLNHGYFANAVGDLLHNLGPDARSVVPDLDEALNDAIARGDDFLLIAISKALAGIAPSSPTAHRAVSVLATKIRQYPDDSILSRSKSSLIQLLGLFGHDAEPALPLLRELSRGDDSWLGRVAQWEIDRIEQALVSVGGTPNPSGLEPVDQPAIP